MTKRMLIDAGHPEETRVVVAENNRVDEFDYEIEDKKPLKGNIYLAKVTRVEPSLQAAFVDYGGNRHGFLPFAEIHPDYYRLPVADREDLIAEEREAQRAAAAANDPDNEDADSDGATEPDAEAEAAAAGAQRRSHAEADETGNGDAVPPDPAVEQVETTHSVETLADDDLEEAARRRAAILGRYKIQEVIKRRQVILIQVVKEERGTKGAALSTYLSLAGRYCVLMPNTDKGGGVSRKISDAKDRKRLKTILAELNIPEGMAVIVRTAGSERTKNEIKRDYDYLLRLWDQVRETTLQSTAPSLIYEEANLIKRSIRDLYTRDMAEVLVQGETGYKAAKAFMRSLMPSHAKKVQRYNDPKLPVFHRFQIEQQLDNIHSPSVQLKSGGYIVINQTEALVAIDVNSGKSTKERHIEETALKTNLEAAEEVARQLKLRDMAGLVVIDFIDMDAPRNNKEVEQRLKDAMRQDRARIQLGRISPFGLLELSRQRLRPSVHETSTEVCSTCGGSGFVRSPESTALHVMRALEEEGVKRGGGEVRLTLPGPIALFVLNEKRGRLYEIENRYALRVRIDTDNTLIPPAYRLDRTSTLSAAEGGADAVPESEQTVPESGQTLLEEEATASGEDTAASEETTEAGRGKRGRRGGRKKRKESPAQATSGETAETSDETATSESRAEEGQSATAEEDVAGADGGDADDGEAESEEKAAARRRRRGKRGGRRRSKRRDESDEEALGATGENGDSADAASEAAEAGETAAAASPDLEGGEVDEAGETAAAASPDLEGGEVDEAGSVESRPGKSGARGSRSNRKRNPRSRKRIAAAAEATAEDAATHRGKGTRRDKAVNGETQAEPDTETGGEGEAITAGAAREPSQSVHASIEMGQVPAETVPEDEAGHGLEMPAGNGGLAPEDSAETVEASPGVENGGAVAPASEVSSEEFEPDTAPTSVPTKSEAVSEAKADPVKVESPANATEHVAEPTEARTTEVEAQIGAPVPEPAATGSEPAQAEITASEAATTETTGPEVTVSETTAAEPAEDAAASEQVQDETPFGQAAEPQGRDDADTVVQTEEAGTKRRGWWQKLLG